MLRPKHNPPRRQFRRSPRNRPSLHLHLHRLHLPREPHVVVLLAHRYFLSYSGKKRSVVQPRGHALGPPWLLCRMRQSSRRRHLRGERDLCMLILVYKLSFVGFCISVCIYTRLFLFVCVHSCICRRGEGESYRKSNEQFILASKSWPHTLQSRWPTADFLSIFTETECS
jgi:hypothetical protein